MNAYEIENPLVSGKEIFQFLQIPILLESITVWFLIRNHGQLTLELLVQKCRLL